MFNSLPNLLSLLRIFLIPVLVVVFYLPYEWAGPAAAAIFGIAGLTDWLDGYLARRMGLQSRMGAFLDPVADKLLVAAVLVLLTGAANSVWVTLPALIIISREITISALREWMAEVGQRGKVAVSYLGKVKTTTQIIALLLLLFEQPLFGLPVYTLGMIMLYVAAILTLWSMIDYLRVALSGTSISAE
ncbi:MAG: CDP-diacylglycerol--glycerol-3-phosphate 3-phosphatidyltransferase [Gammaproteobacteria bacterium]|nr:CDP-diacylglycerol--glycerol-3-phosphate 3-phosphatidyltransferase [Gammaproteobacteria bacterium]